MEKSAKIYVAGHTGMVGSAIVRCLKERGYTNVIGRTHRELDLTRQADVEDFFAGERPEYVFLAAARVGGIRANMRYPAEFLMENLQIQTNILNAAFQNKTEKLIFIGSACVYPYETQQPIEENKLLTGPLEIGKEAYALAKIAGLKACQFYRKEYGADFISVMPCNLYGYQDCFDIQRAHIIPSLIRKFHSAKVNRRDSVTVWGTGKACRELLFAEDLADACLFLMENDTDTDFLNVGYGRDYTVSEIAEQVKKAVGFEGEIVMDPSKPEGIQRRMIDSGQLNRLGWKPKTGLEEGLRLTYRWFLEHVEDRDVPVS